MKRSTLVLLATTAGALGASMPASAQEAAGIPQATEADAREHARSSEIIVVGRSLQIEDNALPVQVLSGDELAHRRQGGLGETLAGLPGVHLDNFGGGASRPVIRGQTLPRIEVLTDGANLFDVSSVSPDHAITTDPLLLDAIEIQRGPAAVRYGGNAANGAINLIDGKVPKQVPDGGITGATEARFGTGDEEKTVVGRITAGIGQFAIHAEGARRVAEDYNVPDAYESGKLRDSFVNSTSYAVGGSWITEKGYIGAAYSRMESRYGLPGHSHANGVCHLHAPDLHCEAHGSFGDEFEGLDDSDTALIDLQSERVDVRADYEDLVPGIDLARLRLSYTDYRHDEIDAGRTFSQYGTKAYDARFELSHAPLLGFSGTVGVQYTDATLNGLNFNPRGVDPSNNKVSTETVGVYLSERAALGPIKLEVGGRYDWRDSTPDYPSFEEAIGLSPEALAMMHPSIQDLLNQIYASDYVVQGARHNLLSLSASATWDIGNGFFAALNLSRSQRAPGARELYAGGNNLATNSYEIGLLRPSLLGSEFPVYASDIKEEARAIDLTFRKVGGPIEFEVGLFHQNIENYIFARLVEEETVNGLPHRLLLYTAAGARFSGLDGQVSYRFTPASRVTVFGDYVEARLKRRDDNLPRIPPGRLGARYEHIAGPVSGDLEYYHTFEQDKVASYETPTPGYDMLNATLSYRFDLGQAKSVELFARGTNLLNDLAYAHTSFVKDQSPLRGRNFVIGMRHAF